MGAYARYCLKLGAFFASAYLFALLVSRLLRNLDQAGTSEVAACTLLAVATMVLGFEVTGARREER